MRVVSFLLTGLIVSIQVAFADWYQFHGPDRNRIISDTKWQQSWDAEGPAELWRINVGQGYSSISVVGDRAYTMGYDLDKGLDTVYCIDIANGNTVWSYQYPCGKKSFLHKGGPASTPTVYEGKVYTISKESHLHCFDAESGEIVWKYDLKEKLGVDLSVCGESSSPLVIGHMLIIDAGVIAAFHTESGNLLWSTKDYEAAYASPVMFEQNGEIRIAAFPGSGVVILHAKSGKEISFYPIKKSMRTVYSSTPIVENGNLFVTSNHKSGAVKLDISKDGNPNVLWNNRNVQTVITSPILWQNRIYSNMWKRDQFVALDYSSGEEIWTSDELKGGPFVIAGEKLLAITGKGELIVAEITDTGLHITGRKQVFGGNCWTNPVLSDGRIYCRNEAGELVCLDVRL